MRIRSCVLLHLFLCITFVPVCYYIVLVCYYICSCLLLYLFLCVTTFARNGATQLSPTALHFVGCLIPPTSTLKTEAEQLVSTNNTTEFHNLEGHSLNTEAFSKRSPLTEG
jgi:hypothetical protein